MSRYGVSTTILPEMAVKYNIPVGTPIHVTYGYDQPLHQYFLEARVLDKDWSRDTEEDDLIDEEMFYRDLDGVEFCSEMTLWNIAHLDQRAYDWAMLDLPF